MENLVHIRDAVVSQQVAASEHRSRLARGTTVPEEYGDLSDEYKNGGSVGMDSKKRRGVSDGSNNEHSLANQFQKAAPPGRCHSCNRAETPEWRRGPDGARTLCNACGLHYAKLTRKMGVNKAVSMTGSGLRKSMEQRV
jgi:hypothetical protein